MMRVGYPSAIAVTLLVASQPAHGRSEYRLGEDGNPWQEVLAGGGEYLKFDGLSVSRRVQVSVNPYSDPESKLADFSVTSMRPLHIAPNVNLVLADIQD